MTFVRVASFADLWEGEMLSCAVGGARVVVIRGDGFVAAYEDRCAHLGVRLSEGTLVGSVLTCRAHLWQYDARTGRGVNPANACLKPFATKVEGGGVFVDVSDDTQP
jgi:toluene monooxygenase system ferredoxin subunit